MTLGGACCIAGAQGIGHINGDVNAQSEGQQAAARVFALSEAAFPIDPLSKEGAKPASVIGAISFEGVKFCYPSRPAQVRCLNMLIRCIGRLLIRTCTHTDTLDVERS